MLRIQRDEVAAHVVVVLPQGRIEGGSADQLERACVELSRFGFRVELDLSEAVFIGRAGIQVLSRLSRAALGIFGCPPVIAARLAQEGIASSSWPSSEGQRNHNRS